MRTQVAIIGGGPAGLLLSQLLHHGGIASVVLERRTRAHVLGRIRAGVIEWGSAEVLRRAGVGAQMDREGFVHEGVNLAVGGHGFRVDFKALTGRAVMIYGQTQVTQDLFAARDAAGGVVIDEASGVTPHDIEADAPYVTYTKAGTEHRVDCDFIVGCDGFHGVSRGCIPASARREFERVYPFGWLGVLSETPPVAGELIYASHERGFALCSMRHAHLSRYYIQVPLTDRPEDWSDDAFWDELRKRIPAAAAETLITGASVEKSIAPLRSYVAEPMRWGRLYLAGDAAHIVPPTGAKGLNLAVSDVHFLSEALERYYKDADTSGLDGYSEQALARVWQAERFSWWMTGLLHRFPDQDGFARRMQEAELANLETSVAAQTAMAETYTGRPY